MQLQTAIFLAAAAVLPSVVAQEFVPDGVGCGIDGFSDAKVSDCREALNDIDINANLATGPSDATDTVQSDPLTQWFILSTVGDCQIAARTLIQTSGGLPAGANPPIGTTFSGQKVHDFINVSMQRGIVSLLCHILGRLISMYRRS